MLTLSRSVLVAQWDDVPVEALQELHGKEIFDSVDHEERSVVNLETYPIEVKVGLEKHIYSMHIPHCKIIVKEGQSVNRMVFDLCQIH